MEMSVALCFEGRIARDLRAARMMPVMLGEVRLRRPDKVRRARQELRSLLATHSFDIAVCHQAWPHAIFGSVLKGAGIPLVSWVHMAQTGGHWLDRLAGRIEPDCYVCNSKYTASLLPPTNARVEVIYAPVAPAPDAPASALDRTRSLRRTRKPNAPSSPIVIVQVSRMEAWKGQRVLLEALARLRDVPEWECWFVGGAQRPAEARYLETLQTTADGARASPIACAFLASDPTCPRCWPRQTSSVRPTSSPRPSASASSRRCMRGLPVVTSSMGGALEIVDDTCGVLVPPDDAPALASALAGLLNNRAERERLGRSGAARAKALCDPATQMRRNRRRARIGGGHARDGPLSMIPVIARKPLSAEEPEYRELEKYRVRFGGRRCTKDSGHARGALAQRAGALRAGIAAGHRIRAGASGDQAARQRPRDRSRGRHLLAHRAAVDALRCRRGRGARHVGAVSHRGWQPRHRQARRASGQGPFRRRIVQQDSVSCRVVRLRVSRRRDPSFAQPAQDADRRAPRAANGRGADSRRESKRGRPDSPQPPPRDRDQPGHGRHGNLLHRGGARLSASSCRGSSASRSIQSTCSRAASCGGGCAGLLRAARLENLLKPPVYVIVAR